MAARCVHGLSALLCLVTAWPLQAQLLLVQRSPLAGFSHHAAPRLWPQLREGDALQLVLQRDNPHDTQAVQLLWQGERLGYLPRSANGALARALDSGLPLQARIGRLREHPDPRQRIEIEVWAGVAP